MLSSNSNHAKSVSLFELPDTACPTSGKKCQLKAGESFSSDSEVVAPCSPDEISGTSKILRQLRQLGEKMDCMDKRVQRMEAALEKGHSQATDILGTAGQVKDYDADENIASECGPLIRIFEE